MQDNIRNPYLITVILDNRPLAIDPGSHHYEKEIPDVVLGEIPCFRLTWTRGQADGLPRNDN